MRVGLQAVGRQSTLNTPSNRPSAPLNGANNESIGVPGVRVIRDLPVRHQE